MSVTTSFCRALAMSRIQTVPLRPVVSGCASHHLVVRQRRRQFARPMMLALTIQSLQLVDWVYQQRIPPWQPYFGLLDKIHQHLVPRTYAEIGVSLGRSLTLALPGTVSIGVDPAPNLQFPVRRGTRIFSQTSDDFFAQHDLRKLFGGLPLDLSPCTLPIDAVTFGSLSFFICTM